MGAREGVVAVAVAAAAAGCELSDEGATGGDGPETLGVAEDDAAAASGGGGGGAPAQLVLAVEAEATSAAVDVAIAGGMGFVCEGSMTGNGIFAAGSNVQGVSLMVVRAIQRIGLVWRSDGCRWKRGSNVCQKSKIHKREDNRKGKSRKEERRMLQAAESRGEVPGKSQAVKLVKAGRFQGREGSEVLCWEREGRAAQSFSTYRYFVRLGVRFTYEVRIHVITIPGTCSDRSCIDYMVPPGAESLPWIPIGQYNETPWSSRCLWRVQNVLLRSGNRV